MQEVVGNELRGAVSHERVASASAEAPPDGIDSALRERVGLSVVNGNVVWRIAVGRPRGGALE